MQAPEKAADELRRAMTKLGLHGAMIGSNVSGKNLDDPSFEPVWATAAELDAFMVIHPGNVAGADRLRSYYLGNLIGNPLDTTIAAACLIFGGVLERYPKLDFVMVHAGGFIPYQGGRWVHGWQVRPEPKVHLKHSPQRYLDRLRYDTITHTKAPLEFLVGSAGADRVFLGSDYPYDMGTLRMRAAGQAPTFPRPTATRFSALTRRRSWQEARARSGIAAMDDRQICCASRRAPRAR